MSDLENRLALAVERSPASLTLTAEQVLGIVAAVLPVVREFTAEQFERAADGHPLDWNTEQDWLRGMAALVRSGR